MEDTVFEKRGCFSQKTSGDRTDGRVTRETFHTVELLQIVISPGFV